MRKYCSSLRRKRMSLMMVAVHMTRGTKYVQTITTMKMTSKTKEPSSAHPGSDAQQTPNFAARSVYVTDQLPAPESPSTSHVKLSSAAHAFDTRTNERTIEAHEADD